MRPLSAIALLNRLVLCTVLLAATGCPATDPGPARGTTTAPPARRTAARATAGQVTVHPLWERKTGQDQARLTVVQLGCVLVLAGPYVSRGTPQRELLCLAPATGKVRWRWKGGQAPLEVIAATRGVVVLRDAAGKQHYVLAKNGGRGYHPKAPLRRRRGSGPLVVAGRRYTATGHAVRCVHEGSGQVIWESPTRGAVSGLRVQKGVVYYAVAGERAIHARDARSGLGRWLHQVRPLKGVKHPRAANFTFAVHRQRLIVARYDGTVGAFTLRRTGKPARRATPRPIPRRGSVVPAGVPRSYVMCGCGCCGGATGRAHGRKVCLYWARGQDIRKLIAQDKQAKKNPQCAVMGCSLGTRYEYCD